MLEHIRFGLNSLQIYVVKFEDKHQNKHVGDHSYTCTVEESGALHNKNHEKSIIPNTQIEQGDKQDCVIEEKIGSVAGLNSLQI
jgi:hypothetical protein